MTSSSPAEVMPRGLRAILARPSLWPVLVLAAVELARARWVLRRWAARDLVAAPATQGRRHDPSLVARVAWAVPRVAARVPWRADCLVQAMAARRWLARNGIETELRIGARKDHPEAFEAHAWLVLGDNVVTGGDIRGFVPLMTRDSLPPT